MSESTAFRNLIAGSSQGIVPMPATVAIGQNLAAGSLLGKVTRALGDVEADAGNTGEGTIGDAALGHGCQIGTYRIECTAAGPPAVFSVIAPDGHRLADATAGVAYAGEIAFEITAYGTPFALGDRFTVEIEAGNGHLRLADRDAVDGSEEPYAILPDAVDASAAAKTTEVWVTGEFSEGNLVFATGSAADDWRDLCAAKGIYLRATAAA